MPGPYGIENDILDRLQAQLGALARVASGAAISLQGLEIAQLAEFGPLVVVEPQGADVSSASSRSDHIVEDQVWTVGIIVRHVSDPETLRGDYGVLDEIIVQAVQALSGWRPTAGLRELAYQGRADVLHEDEGLLGVELTFTVFYNLSTS